MTNDEWSGVLVAIEGIDGAGKTTQVRNLEHVLRAAQVPHVSTKEPTNGHWGQIIRSSAQRGRLPPDEEVEAFVKDRREHVEDVLAPELLAGKVVLVDRYYPSTVAYQGARGIDPNELLERNAFAPTPDVLVVLDIEPAVGLQRIRQRGDRADLFEKEHELAKARAIFKQLQIPNLHIIDAMTPPTDITVAIAERIVDALRRKRSAHLSRLDPSRLRELIPPT